MPEPRIEPYRLRKWRWSEMPTRVVHTCARPGRSEEDTKKDINDAQVRRWLYGLPPAIDAVISLLGTKLDGTSEYRFYGFKYPATTPETWLNSYGIRRLRVIERPTIDFTPVPLDTIEAIRDDLRECLGAGGVVIVDSGGIQRTGQVCEALGMEKLPLIGFE